VNRLTWYKSSTFSQPG